VTGVLPVCLITSLYPDQIISTCRWRQQVLPKPTTTWCHYLWTGSVSEIHARYIVKFMNILSEDTCIFKWLLFFNGNLTFSSAGTCDMTIHGITREWGESHPTYFQVLSWQSAERMKETERLEGVYFLMQHAELLLAFLEVY
jgi:hypothetical protein